MADTVKFRCNNCREENVYELPFDLKVSRYCMKCGHRTENAINAINKRIVAMHDSRILNWHELAECQPLGMESYIVAAKNRNNIWYFKRCTGKENHIIWCGGDSGSGYGMAATHWLPDLLGLPFQP